MITKKLVLLCIATIGFTYASTPWVAIARVIKKNVSSSSSDASQPQKHRHRLFQKNESNS